MQDARTRIFSKIKIDPITECWNWTGNKSRGYGIITINRLPKRVHRIMWEFFNGPIPDKYELDHRVCRNKACSNPVHLVLCTSIENSEQPDGMIGIKRNLKFCKRNHPLIDENVHIDSNGSRQCIICRRIRDKKRWEKNPNNRNMKIALTCKKCGSDFHPYRTREKKSQFCSAKCRWSD